MAARFFSTSMRKRPSHAFFRKVPIFNLPVYTDPFHLPVAVILFPVLTDAPKCEKIPKFHEDLPRGGRQGRPAG